MNSFNYLYLILLAFLACNHPKTNPTTEKVSGAGLALDAFAVARTYPDGRLYTEKFVQAFRATRSQSHLRSEEANWEALGPKNIGGRTLCLAFHPTNPDLIYAGSASGGLWKTTSSGKGAQAWEKIAIGHPVLGVGAIAINPQNPLEIYIGTGEVYNYQNARPGVVMRFTRGSYGIGILKTEDGGITWKPTLDWSYGDLRGVQDILFNPQNPLTLYAATSEGVFITRNGGQSWSNHFEHPMAIDLSLNPVDTNELLATFGSYHSSFTGIFRSQDGGNSFVKLTNGLPDHFTGKALLGRSPSDSKVIYASVANDLKTIGLYKTTNGGDSWSMVNNTDVAKWQGWFSHDVAVHLHDPAKIMYAGIEVFQSVNSGKILNLKADISSRFKGGVEAGQPEGPGNYVHSDNHKVYFDPNNADRVFIASDGGIYASEDGGNSFTSRNGGYQTTQFYANFANSTTDPEFAIGGMQDNWTAIYRGSSSWIRVLGGDGMSAAIDPLNDDIIYGSSQFLNLYRSNQRGESFKIIRPVSGNTEWRSFSAPFELAPSQPNIIYAGAERIYVSSNRGEDWNATNGKPDPPNPILTIAVSPTNSRVIYFSTVPNINLGNIVPGPKVFKSDDGGSSWERMQGLPDRIAMDIAIHPFDDAIVYAVFGGFNTAHVYKTTNGGLSWNAADNGLPDLPTSTVVINPDNPDLLYIGNDIGVYISENGGENWTFFSGDLPDAVLVMHLSISPVNRKLRVATHGSGVFQTDLSGEALSGSTLPPGRTESFEKIYPNPVSGPLTAEFDLGIQGYVRFNLFDIQGRLVSVLYEGVKRKGAHKLELNFKSLSQGVYVLQMEVERKEQCVQINKPLVKL